jgi:hypothetical protein
MCRESVLNVIPIEFNVLRLDAYSLFGLRITGSDCFSVYLVSCGTSRENTNLHNYTLLDIFCLMSVDDINYQSFSRVIHCSCDVKIRYITKDLIAVFFTDGAHI